LAIRLLKEQKKYDQVPSGLCDQLQRILPLAKKVADATLSEEIEILKGLIPRMFEVMHRVAKLCATMSNVVGYHLLDLGKC